MSSWPLDKILDLAVAVQQIPAPTFEEGSRAAFLRSTFLAEGLLDVEMDDLSNVSARLPGRGRATPLVITAHLDSVFPKETDLTVVRDGDEIRGPGIGDNALGVAGLLALVWGLRSRDLTLPGDLILVGTVGEEGLGDLRGMQAVVDRLDGDALAYLVLEGMALGHVFHRGMRVQRYRITVQTPGGHSWVDYGTPSAVHELTRLVGRILDLPLPQEPRTSLNVGRIQGGMAVNAIAARALVEVDMRSERGKAVTDLARRVRRVVREASGREVDVHMERIGDRPEGQIPADHPLVRLAWESLQKQGITPHLSLGSTDASVPLSRGLPAVCLGLTTGGGAHTTQEFIHCPPLAYGLDQLLAVVQGAFDVL
jgi:acetylornithine deacetylase/succinyl-diaminopimelate desuccinylase-like protein